MLTLFYLVGKPEPNEDYFDLEKDIKRGVKTFDRRLVWIKQDGDDDDDDDEIGDDDDDDDENVQYANPEQRENIEINPEEFVYRKFKIFKTVNINVNKNVNKKIILRNFS